MTNEALQLLERLHNLLEHHKQPSEETNEKLSEFYSQELRMLTDKEAIELLCAALSIESFSMLQTAEKLRNLGN